MPHQARNRLPSLVHPIQRSSTTRVAWVNEPSLPECRPDKQWRLKLLKRQDSDKFEIEVGFYDRGGDPQLTQIDNGSRSDTDRIRKELLSRNARLPEDRRRAMAFTQELIRQTPTVPVIVCRSPGFCNDGNGFVMPYKRYGSAVDRYLWDSTVPKEFGEIEGDLDEYRRGVLRLALRSPYLSLAIMIGLAGVLPDYVEHKTKERLLTETAIFHFAAATSMGKTNLARAVQSVFGSPEIDNDYDGSDAGIAEQAYFRNNLALVIDDTDYKDDGPAELFAAIRKHAQRIPSGRYRTLSSRGGKPNLLRWSLNGVSTGPKTVARLAKDLGKGRHGDQVRVMDIKLENRGGLFGSLTTANGAPPGDSAKLVAALEKHLPTAHGVLFDAFITHLLEQDLTERVKELFYEFVDAVVTSSNGLEKRFAKKFAILYAAGAIANEAGYLGWPEDWPMRAVRSCYENSVEQRDPDRVFLLRSCKRLVIKRAELFPKMDPRRGRYSEWTDDQIGFRKTSGEQTVYYLARERAHLADQDSSSIAAALFGRLKEMTFIESGPNATSSDPFRVRSPSGKIVKVRFWRLDMRKLAKWAFPEGVPKTHTSVRRKSTVAG
jgi:hypothetical protein